jgi:hypothetical protein
VTPGDFRMQAQGNVRQALMVISTGTGRHMVLHTGECAWA